MPTLLLRLKGPMQSWGTRSHFDTRDTESEPSKSGVLGLICAAMGIPRENWDNLAPMTQLKFGVRIDDPGTIRRDYHTALDVVVTDGSTSRTAVTDRYYLADASFLAGFESEDVTLLENIQKALMTPYWQIFLGRKSFVPSEPVFIEDGLLYLSLEDALKEYPYKVYSYRRSDLIQKNVISIQDEQGTVIRPDQAELILKLESSTREGHVYTDQPRAAFSERKFRPRYVVTKTVIKDVIYDENE